MMMMINDLSAAATVNISHLIDAHALQTGSLQSRFPLFKHTA